MLKFTDLSLRRGTRELLHDVSFTIHPGQKVGLTGANGVGKSTLFALVRGELHADKGDFYIPAQWVIAHVAQETPGVDRPAIEYVLDGDAELRKIQQQIAEAEQAGLGDRLATLYTRLDAIDGYTANSRAAKLMHGLGFKPGQEHTPVTDFSGGWRMRLNLAQALMCRSDLLLLDEPTNHLDLEAVIWLEEWLRAYPGTLLLISHDRDFLDRVVTHIAHIEQCKLTLYTGNYSAFEIKRAEVLAQQQSLYEKQQREIAHMQHFIDRFRAKATKARQAQSRIKALERMEIISAAHVDSPFHFEFRKPDKLPHTLLQLEMADVGYAENIILKNVGLVISQGERIGLLGHNGAGKSTLIKMLAGEIAPLSGAREDAKDLKLGYFAQHQLEQLDDHATPLLHLQRMDKNATEQSLRDFLGGFGFAGDMVNAPVAPFSGGEKARLVLAMIVYQKPNFLLLDEPTNHLDLDMRHALTAALQDFEGAMIIVSHDRHLLRTVTDTLMLVDQGRVLPFDGDLDDYYAWIQDQKRTDKTETKPGTDTAVNKKQNRQDAAERRRLLQPLRNKVKKLEQQMDALNKEKADVENQLSDSAVYDESNKDKLKKLLARQAEVASQVSAVEEQWLEASAELEELES